MPSVFEIRCTKNSVQVRSAPRSAVSLSGGNHFAAKKVAARHAPGTPYFTTSRRGAIEPLPSSTASENETGGTTTSQTTSGSTFTLATTNKAQQTHQPYQQRLETISIAHHLLNAAPHPHLPSIAASFPNPGARTQLSLPIASRAPSSAILQSF